jgi:hypothetical protein
MSNKVSYKNLFQLVTEQIDKRVSYNNKSSFDTQLSRVSVSPLTGSDRSDASTGELITAIQSLLSESLPSWIISGLTVEATTPISNQVTVSTGKGTVGGFLYELSTAVTLTIPFNSTNEVFYITLYKDNIYIDKTLNTERLTIAKIIVPNPGVTSLIQDEKDNSWNAYIVNFKEYKLYGHNDKFEEDTIELLRDNINPILADNLIGNIRLNEDLKIINTQGTMELDSSEMRLLDVSGNTLAKFNRNGTFFYDENNTTVAKFGRDEAYIGNILITKNSLQSRNYVAGSTGFKIEDDGDVEFSDGTFRGILSAVTGNIGGWTIDSSSIYATTTGTLKTSATVGVGSDGVILDKDGLRVYDSVLGLVVNLPSNGDSPTFSSGVIQETIFEINTNAVLRTSENVGDGTINSAGILINNTGIYGCEASQLLQDANLKALIDGTISIKGEITATSGSIANISITNEGLSGGLIEGSTIRGSVIETSSTAPKIRIDSLGMYYQTSTTIGKYGASTSGNYGFKYGSGTKYGSSVTAYLFKNDYPVLSIESELDTADIRLYNRTTAPTSGTHELGDIIVINGLLYRCSVAGTPGTFTEVNTTSTYALEDLSDVIVNSGTTDGDILTWDSGDSIWRNKQPVSMAYTETRYYLGSFSRDMTTASGNQTITLSGITWTPKAIVCISGQTNIPGHLSFGMYANGYNDNSTHDAWAALNGAFVIGDGNFAYILQDAGGTTAYYGDVASTGAGEFVISWTKVGSSTGTLTCMYLAFR